MKTLRPEARVAIGLGIVLALSAVRFPLTHSRTDGYEQIGFPWAFYEQGGFAFRQHFFVHWLIADILVAFIIAWLIGFLPRKGIFGLLHWARSWGTPQAD